MLLAAALLAATAAPAPDYANGANWLCLPGRTDICSTPLKTTALNPHGYGSSGLSPVVKDAGVDCFYVYPTVSRDQGVNSDLRASEETAAAEVQFADHPEGHRVELRVEHVRARVGHRHADRRRQPRTIELCEGADDGAFGGPVQVEQAQSRPDPGVHQFGRELLAADREARRTHEGRSGLVASIGELTPREREVLGEMIAGYLSKQIAAHLNISTKTVEAHRLRIYQKFNVHTSMELAARLRDVPPSLWEGTA